MASLRDVLNHIGKKVRIERADESEREGLGLIRGNKAFTEANLAPQAGERVTLLETGEVYRVVSSLPKMIGGRVDHFELEVAKL